VDRRLLLARIIMICMPMAVSPFNTGSDMPMMISVMISG
jgi:hypothetical protein